MPDRRTRALPGVLGLLGAQGAHGALSRGRERAGGTLGHRFPTVAVTGMTGVGKRSWWTTSAAAARRTGAPDAGSAVLERRVRRGRRLTGFRFRVVPGDNAAARLGALDEVFHDDPVDGVLHVVANGQRHRPPPRRHHGRRAGHPGAAARRRAGRLGDHRPPDRRHGRPPLAADLAGRRGHQGGPLPGLRRGRRPELTRPAAGRRSATASTTSARWPAGPNLSIDVLPACSHLEGDSVVSRKQRDALPRRRSRRGWPSSPATSDRSCRFTRGVGFITVCRRTPRFPRSIHRGERRFIDIP